MDGWMDGWMAWITYFSISRQSKAEEEHKYPQSASSFIGFSKCLAHFEVANSWSRVANEIRYSLL